MELLGNKGFTNHGNTCYMNSALQCLSHLPQLRHDCLEFTEGCQKRLKSNNYDLMNEWLKLQTCMWEDNENKVINTIDLLRSFINECNTKNIYFESFVQNDCSDFLNIFIDLLHQCIRRRVNVTIIGTPKTRYDELKLQSIKSWSSFFEKNYSFIIDQFFSQTLGCTSCPKCDYLTTNHEPMMVIPLTIKQSYNNIYDCLNEYVKEIVLDTDNTWKCDKCHEMVCPHKKTNFWELSPILIFQIKKYHDINNVIHKKLKYPKTIDMKDYCFNIKKYSTKYSLYGICIHNGSLGGGHYYAMCKNDKYNTWNIYNDTNVRKTSLQDVLNQTPYCLFYVRDNN